MTRCSCGGLLQVVEHALERTVYECRRCRKRWEWKTAPVPVLILTQCRDRKEYGGVV